MSRRFESGASKRKAKKAREEFEEKIPKLTSFFQSTETDTKIENQLEDTEESIQLVRANENRTQNDDTNVFDKNGQDTYPNNNVKTAVMPENNDKESLHKDPALWPSYLNSNEPERRKYLDKGYLFFQNKESSFKSSKRKYAKQNRYFNPSYFQRKLNNGEICERKWLIFSESTGSVYCYVCKLFSNDHSNMFVKSGFSNWKKVDETICSHENSKEHNRCMINWINYLDKSANLDKALARSINCEVNYWTDILKRVLVAIKFLAERGLAFRGTDEVFGSPNNGNYLGLLEAIAEFDPFIREHIKLHGNKGRGHVSYLSKTICEEFIGLMAQEIIKYIKDEIKKAKYWGLVVDSTPDISHVDQLSVIFRYYLNGHVYERFFCFLQIKSHVGESLAIDILQLLVEHKIDINNCRAQTYDNASNMSGKYSGLQACLREKNPLAFYVPCVGHSLNLVGECSVAECINAVNFFGILQRLYAFFSASTHRWNILVEQKKSKLTSLSDTRWSCKADALNGLIKYYDGVCKALSQIVEDQNQKSNTRHEAASLRNNIMKLENVFMAVFWNRILSRFNVTSKFLQKVEVDLSTANDMLASLVDFVQDFRNQFSSIENEAKNLSLFVIQDYCDSNKRTITRNLRDSETQVESLQGSDKFKIQTSFYIIIDKLITELKKRSEAYSYIINLFGFLTELLTIDIDTMKTKVKALIKVYSKDLQENLICELEQFIPLLKLQPKGFFSNNTDKITNTLFPLIVLNWLVEREMIDVFPNVYIAYRLFITIPIANCESERSFSVLKRIKNMYRATMKDERLSDLAILAIENELLRSIDFDTIIKKFAEEKSRKKFFP